MRKAYVIAVLVAAGAIMTAAQAPQQAPQPPIPPAGGQRGGPPPARGGGGMLAGAGPSDKPVVDPAAADRGRKVWAGECIDCHGAQARGGEKGPNLVRSVIVLRDRYGSQIGPFLKKGHKLQSGTPSANLTDAQVQDLAHFLRQKVNDGLRGSPLFQVQNILTGDAKAGATYFNGEGKCTTCHSPAGNLAGIGARLEPVDIQQRFLFPATGRGGRGRGAPAGPNPNAVRVTVTPAAGTPITGVLVQMDDFYVTLRNADGAIQTVRRGPAVKVEKTDPLTFHNELLDKITDKNMHDIVAYLESLK
jgi:cytochrome c oxidase cbb3-type subunit 3